MALQPIPVTAPAARITFLAFFCFGDGHYGYHNIDDTVKDGGNLQGWRHRIEVRDQNDKLLTVVNCTGYVKQVD